MNITRNEAWNLLPEYNREEFHLKHAVDELTGLIGAAAILRPPKSVSDPELKSVKKKYKNANFAAGCSRKVIECGAGMFGWTPDALITRTVLAMRTVDAAD